MDILDHLLFHIMLNGQREREREREREKGGEGI